VLGEQRRVEKRLEFSGSTNGYYITGIRKNDLASVKININGNALFEWEVDEIEEFVE
jgi:hypothetical protein